MTKYLMTVTLLKLSSPVTFSNFVSPVCLAAEGSVIGDGILTWVTGYGTTSSGGDIAQQLQEVNIPIMSNARCKTAYSVLTENMLCAGREGKGSCQGDSGGPLVIKRDSQWIQPGVVNFGRGCGAAGFPGVYARVSQYQSWINESIPTGEQPGFVRFSLVDNPPPPPPPPPPTTTNGGTTPGMPVFLSLAVPLLISFIFS